MKQLRTFCCVTSLRTGSFIIGFQGIFGSGIGILMSILYLTSMPSLKAVLEEEKESSPHVKGLIATWIACVAACTIQLVAYIILIAGIKSERVLLICFWVVYNSFVCTISTLAVIYAAYCTVLIHNTAEANAYEEMLLKIIGVGVVLIGMFVYFGLVVSAYLKEVRSKVVSISREHIAD